MKQAPTVARQPRPRKECTTARGLAPETTRPCFLRRKPPPHWCEVHTLRGEEHYVNGASGEALGRGAELWPKVLDVRALPWGLNGARVVVLADIANRMASGDAIADSEAGERRPGSAAPPAARDLDAFPSQSLVQLEEGLAGVGRIRRQPPVQPTHPHRGPRRWRRRLSLQVEREVPDPRRLAKGGVDRDRGPITPKGDGSHRPPGDRGQA